MEEINQTEVIKMSVISMKQLLEAGVHFGHQTRRWNPKMAPYIYTERNGIYIIDLQQSVGMVDDAYMQSLYSPEGKIGFLRNEIYHFQRNRKSIHLFLMYSL